MNCQRPDCHGEIVDGYCDECGLAPAGAPSGDSGLTAAALGGQQGGATKCERPGCAGEIVDGYCNKCGLAPAPGVDSRTVAAGRPSTPTTGTPRSNRQRWAEGLVEIPEIPAEDPADAVMKDPSVPESRRFCARCGHPVGRSRDGDPGRTEGWCSQCGEPFSFTPKLKAGDLVAGQYEIAGPLAHGGMGWVYGARDRNVSGRWVVLKGLLNTSDEDAMAAALAEREFLAEVDHPNIVKIFNFVEHEDAGYIVMAYVGGRSLKQILLARREIAAGTPSPLPPAEAIAYIYEILPALGYLHEHRLLFCDFKIDNVMQTRYALTLIDLGGVYRMDKPASPVFGTVGYQAPEIEKQGPTVASDLFTVARTLAVLCINFPEYRNKHRYTLPPQESVPLFQRYDSLYRWLQKGMAPDPADRFSSAQEMRQQLLGVLREVVADTENRAVPAASALFTSPVRAGTERSDWRVLPRPQASADDPNAGYLAALTVASPQALIAQLKAAPDPTIEVDLRMAGALIDSGDLDAAEQLLAELAEREPHDWRIPWYRGISALAAGRAAAARTLFDSVCADVPGELAPKVGLGIACEQAGDTVGACRWYGIVAQTDPSITSASFGLARCRLPGGDRVGALAAYERVPDTSSGYLDAQVARLRCALDGVPSLADLRSADEVLHDMPVDDEQRDRLTAELFGAAVRLVDRDPAASDPEATLSGRHVEQRALRLGLESSLRALARRAVTRDARIALVDEANRVRPRTWT